MDRIREMNEAAIRQKIYHMLHTSYDYTPITQTDASKCHVCGTLITPPIGRPDILALHHAVSGVVIEVKTVRAGEQSFPVKRITEDQRDWLTDWKGLGYIGLGIIRPAGSRHRLEAVYLVPWDTWLSTEKTIGDRKSIPLETIRERFEQFMLIRDDGRWYVSNEHSLHQLGVQCQRQVNLQNS